MTLKNIFLFLGFFNIFLGIYQFMFLYITKKSFDIKVKEEGYDGTWFSFCCENFDSWIWKLRNKSKFRLFYRSKLFIIFLRLRGIILCLNGLIFIFVLFWAYDTEYWILFTQVL